MKKTVTIALASLLAVSPVAGVAYAQDAMSTGSITADNVSVVQISTLEGDDTHPGEHERLMGLSNDPAELTEIANVSKHFLAKDLGVLMKMCDASATRKQTNAFKEFLEALQKEQPYIASNARLSQHRAQANAEQTAEDARRAEIERKAWARKAERDKAYQAAEDARDAKIRNDQAAVREEKALKAQRDEAARQQALAARTPEQVTRDNERYEDAQFCYKYAAMNKVATDANNQGLSIERAEQILVDARGLKGQDAEDMRATIRVVRLTHANDTPNQAFTIENDRCLALRAKKRAAGTLVN